METPNLGLSKHYIGKQTVPLTIAEANELNEVIREYSEKIIDLYKNKEATKKVLKDEREFSTEKAIERAIYYEH